MQSEPQTLQTGTVRFGEDLTYRIITRNDMARLALWSLRYALDGDRDGQAVRGMLLKLARNKMLQPQDIVVIIEDVRTALVGQPAARAWDGFIQELEQLTGGGD